jgi:hypothetical protein
MKLRWLRLKTKKLRLKLRLKAPYSLKSYAATPIPSRVYTHIHAHTCAHTHTRILCRSYRIHRSLSMNIRNRGVALGVAFIGSGVAFQLMVKKA